MKQIQWLIGVGAFLFVLVGCADVSVHPDPTPQLAGEIDSAAVAVSSADGHLARVPAEVPAARVDLSSASSHLTGAKAQISRVSAAFNAEASGRARAESEVEKLKADFWSVRQRHLFWWLVAGAVTLGVLYVLGLSGSTWIAWLVPLVHTLIRMVVTGFVPEVVRVVGWVISLFKRKTPEASAGSEIFPQASVHP